ncbi:hypothetical protein [Streptomyces sp. 021-4]|uniref:hypothetical protein n=1 Tax=Streptomyces sp. 021-4 TaxID=2789260 RepID=UPI0039F45007
MKAPIRTSWSPPWSAGLAVSRPDGPEAEAADAARDPETGVLSLLETHFGISLSSREVREGKLLCAVRPA